MSRYFGTLFVGRGVYSRRFKTMLLSFGTRTLRVLPHPLHFVQHLPIRGRQDDVPMLRHVVRRAGACSRRNKTILHYLWHTDASRPTPHPPLSRSPFSRWRRLKTPRCFATLFVGRGLAPAVTKRYYIIFTTPPAAATPDIIFRL